MDKRVPVLAVPFSLFAAFTSPLLPLPSSVSVLHPLTGLCIFSGGIWFHHGLLGLRGSHNDWRTVHLQPQGGGPHLPGLPRRYWVGVMGASLLGVGPLLEGAEPRPRVLQDPFKCSMYKKRVDFKCRCTKPLIKT